MASTPPSNLYMPTQNNPPDGWNQLRSAYAAEQAAGQEVFLLIENVRNIDLRLAETFISYRAKYDAPTNQEDEHRTFLVMGMTETHITFATHRQAPGVTLPCANLSEPVKLAAEYLSVTFRCQVEVGELSYLGQDRFEYIEA